MANEETARCAFKHEGLPDDYQCLQPVGFDGRQVCLFHWNPQDEDEKKRKAGLFNECFAALAEEFEVKPEEEQIRNPLDCRGFVFPAGFSFFEEREVPPANFLFATFGEGTLFGVAKFGEGGSFSEVKFGEFASFFRAKFGGGTSFELATFCNRAIFFNARFGGNMNFHRAKFGAGTSFEKAEFGSGASFHRAAFGDGTDFRHADFTGSAAFEEAVALGSLAFPGLPESPGSCIFSGGAKVPVSFERVRLDRPDRVLFSSANLKGVSFLNTDVTGVNFVDAAWPKDKKGNISFPGRILTGVKFEKSPSRATLEWLERLCQQLKLNYENKRNYAAGGEFHFAEMEYRRRRYAGSGAGRGSGSVFPGWRSGSTRPSRATGSGSAGRPGFSSPPSPSRPPPRASSAFTTPRGGSKNRT